MSLPKLNRPPIGTPVLQVATYGPPAEISALRHTRQWETWSDETYKAVSGLLAVASLTHVETLTADSVITQGAPTADGELLVVLLTQDGTGGWTITWDTAVFDGSAKVDIDARMNISTLFLFVGNGGFWVQVSPAFSLGTGLVSPFTVIGNGRDEIVLATTGQIITNGTGSPETVITAVRGSLYLEDDGTVWRKATGTGNTGWVDISGATDGAWSAYTATITATGLMTISGTTQDCAYLQLGKRVYLRISFTTTVGGTPSNSFTASLPVAAKNSPQALAATTSSGTSTAAGADIVGGVLTIQRLGSTFPIGSNSVTAQGVYEAA